MYSANVMGPWSPIARRIASATCSLMARSMRRWGHAWENPGVVDELRLAASVIAGRDGSAGLELLVIERSRSSRFLPGYVAFPGGATDPGDADLAVEWFGTADEISAPARCVSGYLGEIESMVHDGQQQHRIDGKLVPRTAAMLFLGMIVPAGILWHLTDSGFNLTQHAGRVWKMFEQALGARGTGVGRTKNGLRQKPVLPAPSYEVI